MHMSTASLPIAVNIKLQGTFYPSGVYFIFWFQISDDDRAVVTGGGEGVGGRTGRRKNVWELTLNPMKQHIFG